MEKKYFKKFEGLFSLFSIQSLACIKINAYTKASLYVDTKYFFKEGYLVVYIYQNDVERVRAYVFNELKKNPDYLSKLYSDSVKGFESFNHKYDRFSKEINEIEKVGDLKRWIHDFI